MLPAAKTHPHIGITNDPNLPKLSPCTCQPPKSRVTGHRPLQAQA